MVSRWVLSYHYNVFPFWFISYQRSRDFFLTSRREPLFRSSTARGVVIEPRHNTSAFFRRTRHTRLKERPFQLWKASSKHTPRSWAIKVLPWTETPRRIRENIKNANPSRAMQNWEGRRFHPPDSLHLSNVNKYKFALRSEFNLFCLIFLIKGTGLRINGMRCLFWHSCYLLQVWKQSIWFFCMIFKTYKNSIKRWNR